MSTRHRHADGRRRLRHALAAATEPAVFLALVAVLGYLAAVVLAVTR